MAGQPSLNQYVAVEGLRALQRLLKPPDELLAEPWKFAMTLLAQIGEVSGKRGAPRLSGALRDKIYGRVHKQAFPRWAAVRSRGTAKSKKTGRIWKSARYPRGFPYPRALNYSAKYGHQGWFDRGVIAPVLARANQVLDRAADQIADKWERG